MGFMHPQLLQLRTSKIKGRTKGKEQVKDNDDTLDTMGEYVKNPSHGSTPSAQITFPWGFFEGGVSFCSTL
jgi:hypothetical protein